MSNSYDNWLSTTPEDEEEAAREREKRRIAAAEYKAENPRYYSAQFVNGRRVYEEDFIYDPLSRSGYE